MIILFASISLFLGINFLREYSIIIGIISVVVLTIALRNCSKKILIIFPACFFLGCAISQINPSFNPKNNEFNGIVIESENNYYLIYSGGERFYVYEKNNTKENGDIITVIGKPENISFETLQSEFNFNSYLKNKGCVREIKAKRVVTNLSFFIRKKEIKKAFLNSFDSNTQSLISTLLFNDVNYDNSLINNISNLNLLYIFSVSGIYLRVVILLNEKFFKLFVKEKTSKIFTLISLSLYFFFAAEKVSILRIFLVYLFNIINSNLLKNRFNYLEILGFCCLLLLILNRYYAYQMSFYLGFAVSLLIYFCSSIIKSKSKFISKVLITLMIFLFMIPINISFTNELHVFGIIYQLILIPINTVFTIVSIFSFYFFPIVDILKFFAKCLFVLINCFSEYDIKIYVKNFNVYYSLIYYSLYFLTLFALESKFSLFIKINSITFLAFLISTTIPFNYFYEQSVSFINVGQGDSTLINSGRFHYLIDTGGNLYKDIANDCLIPYFKSNLIYKIDGVFISHYDFDHSGALESLKKQFNIVNIYDYSSSYPIKCNNFLVYNLNQNNHDNDNDNSTVLYFDFMGKKWLFTGDISSKIENEIMKNNDKLNVDILKVSHHGSTSGTSKKFINFIKPKEAIISVGKNKYGHPSKEVISILKQFNVIIRRTDIDGTISYNSFAFNI